MDDGRSESVYSSAARNLLYTGVKVISNIQRRDST